MRNKKARCRRSEVKNALDMNQSCRLILPNDALLPACSAADEDGSILAILAKPLGAGKKTLRQRMWPASDIPYGH